MEPVTLPVVTPEQMAEVERLMVDEYHISQLQMMENAGRSLALLAKQMLDNDLADRPVVVLAGRGKNGGGGLAAARHLLNWGAWVQVVCTNVPEDYEGVPALQLRSLQAMGAPLGWAEEGWELPPADLVIDAILGCGLHGEPRGKVRDLIQLANSSMAPILSLDVPSGVNVGDGSLLTPHIQAAATLMLALPKSGLSAAESRPVWGDLYLADVGVPPELYAHIGLDVPPLFGGSPILPFDMVDGVATVQDWGEFDELDG